MEEALAKQRAACPFCKIVAGEIPSQKVYEDDGFLAILDIRPAAPGHVLLLPKEHAPILQLLPEPRLRAAFPLAAKIANAVRDATLSPGVDIVVVNGLAPGNQAMHALVHLIPREAGDGLDQLDIEKLETAQADTLALVPQLESTVRDVVKRLGYGQVVAPTPSTPPELSPEGPFATPTSRSPPPPSGAAGSASAPVHAPHPAPAPVSDTKEFEDPKQALAHILEMHPDLRKLLIAQPELVTQYVEQSPRLQRIFAGVDIAALSAALRAQEQGSQEGPTAAQMSDPELFAFIDRNEGLRQWMLESPDELAASVPGNPRLAMFFAGVDVREIANRFAAFKGGQ